MVSRRTEQTKYSIRYIKYKPLLPKKKEKDFIEEKMRFKKSRKA